MDKLTPPQRKIIERSYFRNAKVGDRVFSLEFGSGYINDIEIKEINFSCQESLGNNDNLDINHIVTITVAFKCKSYENEKYCVSGVRNIKAFIRPFQTLFYFDHLINIIKNKKSILRIDEFGDDIIIKYEGYP